MIEMPLDANGDIPDLGDLIPQNNRQITGRRNREGELINQDMNEGEQENQLAAARFGGSGGPGDGSVSKETPISNYPSLSYGLQETHTTILPWTGWFSAVALGKGLPAQLKVRMNTPYDMLDVTFAATPAAGRQWSGPALGSTSQSSSISM